MITKGEITMTVLLTGGAGYIGSHTCIALTEAGYDVVIVDDHSNSSPSVIPRLNRLTGKEIPCHVLDVRDEQALDQVFAAYDIESVIHLAGKKAVGESVTSPLAYYDSNVGGLITLLRVMQKHQVKQLVFSSSAAVYGDPEVLPVNETMPAGRCANPYGRTKFMSEEIIRDHAAAEPGFSAVLLRYFNPLGAHESGELGEDPAGIPNNIMPYVSRVAAGKLPVLSVFGDDYDTPDGTCVRDYIHVMDLAEGHAAALKYCAAHVGSEVFNLGTGSGHSVMELVNTFAEVNQVSVPFRMAPRREGDIPVCYSDAGKAHKLLGWKSKRTLADMCRSAWIWQTKNPNGYAK